MITIASPFPFSVFLGESVDINIQMIRSARVPLKGWQQAAVAVGSALGALMDPRRADLIAALGETTGKPSFQNTLDRMKRSQEGRVSDLLSFVLPHVFFSTSDFSVAFITF